MTKKTQLKSYSGGGRVKAMTSAFNLISVRCGRFSLNNNDLNLDRFLSQAIVGLVVLEYSAQVMDYFYDFLMVLLGDWRPCSPFNNIIWKRGGRTICWTSPFVFHEKKKDVGFRMIWDWVNDDSSHFGVNFFVVFQDYTEQYSEGCFCF